ncbi:MAG TPA: hypothetical protein VEA92_02565 [Candidatus Paceibacterota bacterium]|nr:hypothetical protein [Candidatus Paceibacterota bacterium]
MSKKAFTRQGLKTFLKLFGAPVSKYGKGIAKTLEDLYLSVASEEIAISLYRRELKSGFMLVPLLTCRKVKIDIYCKVNGVLWYLVEGEQLLQNGKRRRRSLKRSASEKIGKGESYSVGARRCLIEELGLVFTPETEPEFYPYEEYFATPRLSNSFPGTYVNGKRHKVVMQLHPDLFNSDGYTEYKNGKPRTHFSWKRADEVWEIT